MAAFARAWISRRSRCQTGCQPARRIGRVAGGGSSRGLVQFDERLVAGADVGVAAAAPDVATPDIAASDVAAAVAGEADVAAPDVSTADVAAPDVAAPDVAAPDVAAPDVTAPDIAAPDVERQRPHRIAALGVDVVRAHISPPAQFLQPDERPFIAFISERFSVAAVEVDVLRARRCPSFDFSGGTKNAVRIPVDLALGGDGVQPDHPATDHPIGFLVCR